MSELSEDVLSETASAENLPSNNLAKLGLVLPGVAAPVAAYVPATVDRGVARTSGQLPSVDGKLTCTGAVGEGGTDPQAAYQAAQTAALNALAAAASAAGGLDNLRGVVKVTGFVSSRPDFFGQAGVVNGASELFGKVFPADGGHIRSAVGVAVLPLDASVEIEAEFALR